MDWESRLFVSVVGGSEARFVRIKQVGIEVSFVHSKYYSPIILISFQEPL